MRVSTGIEVFDEMLEGGFEADTITTIYGPAGSGKTNICLSCMARTAREGSKVIYFDTEGGYSVERLKQIAPDYEKILKNVFFFRPTSFAEQKANFERFKQLMDESTTKKIRLIIVDTISMLYRVELGQSDDIYTVNSELGKQISYLSEIARKKSIPVLITNQVYTDPETNSIKMVGGDLLKYWSKCLIEVERFKTYRRAVLRKHRSIPENKEVYFEIKHDGIKKVEE